MTIAPNNDPVSQIRARLRRLYPEVVEHPAPPDDPGQPDPPGCDEVPSALAEFFDRSSTDPEALISELAEVLAEDPQAMRRGWWPNILQRLMAMAPEYLLSLAERMEEVRKSLCTAPPNPPAPEPLDEGGNDPGG